MLDRGSPDGQVWGAYRGSFLARTLLSNFTPFRATYSASLSMTGWMSGGGGMMAAAEDEGWLTLGWGVEELNERDGQRCRECLDGL